MNYGTWTFLYLFTERSILQAIFICKRFLSRSAKSASPNGSDLLNGSETFEAWDAFYDLLEKKDIDQRDLELMAAAL
jgi:hypothetical protein